MELAEVDHEPSVPEQVLEPELAIVDAHHHLWPPGYWIPYDVDALASDLGRGGNVVATVFVECGTSFRGDGDDAMRPVGETEFVVGSTPRGASGTEIAAAVVGWADLMDPAGAARTLEGHLEAGEGRFRGVRFNVTWDERVTTVTHPGRELAPQMLLDDRYRAGLREVARRDLTYDVWLYHRQLLELADAMDAVPDLTFVVDHLGSPVPDEPSPAARAAAFEEWRVGLAAVARRPNAVVKIGGLGMPVHGFVFDTDRPPSSALAASWRPYFEAAIEAFGADRCMFESNFPVDKQGFSYDSVWNAYKILARGCSADERSHLFSGTARRVYRLPDVDIARAEDNGT